MSVPSSEQYRALAQQCELSAEKAHEPDARRTYQKLAKEWWKLAEEFDAIDRSEQPDKPDRPGERQTYPEP